MMGLTMWILARLTAVATGLMLSACATAPDGSYYAAPNDPNTALMSQILHRAAMAGGDDPLIPMINARIMQWLIPDARLAIVDCGHLFLVTRAAESARIVDAFLTEPRSRAGRAQNHPLTTSRRPP